MSDLFANPAPARTQVWSCGGGTQSAAIAALIVRGDLPKPDLAVIVDTEREKSATWRYWEVVLVPELAKVGVELARVPKSAFATVDLYGKNGDLLLPVYTTQGGAASKLSAYCSGEWKRDVAMRWMRAQGVKEGVNWLGISCEELRRVRQPRRQWLLHYYPLLERRMTRQSCRVLVEAMGWPKPPRSACWQCPNMGDAEWVEMRESDPEDFARAVALEREVRARDSHAYLHRSAVPLDEVEFAAQDEGGLLAGCESGFCFV